MTITYTGSWGPADANTDHAVIELDRFVAKHNGEHNISCQMTSSYSANTSSTIYLTVDDIEVSSQLERISIGTGRVISLTHSQTLTAGQVVSFEWSSGKGPWNASFSWDIVAPATDEGPPLTSVTPQAPTFLDEEPWVVIPSQVGVTYSTSGTPGWNSSVTVTATADEGYVITGQSSWSKEWGQRPLPANAIPQEDIEMVYFGAEEAQALYRGSLLVWEAITDLYLDAGIWLPFDDGRALYKNEGTAGSVGVDHLGGSITHEYDHAYFSTTGRIRVYSPPSSTWEDGYTFSVWVKDMQPNTGWWPVLWRGPVFGPPNETYLGFNTGATTSSLEAYLKLGSGSHISNATRTVPVSGWNHVAVVWRRVSSSTYSCTFYINGLSSGTSSGGGYSPGDTFSDDQIVFGSQGWAGGVDDYAVWDRPLSTEEVLEVYNQGRSIVPHILTTSLPDFTLNNAVSFQMTANFPVTSWSATGLPAGLSLNASTGRITGTPSSAGSGTASVTATGTDGQSAHSVYPWTVIAIPALTSRSITANGAKTSHNGWARPAVTWSLNSGGGNWNSDGTLIMNYGRGHISATATLSNTRRGRIVSNLKGVISTSASSSGISLRVNNLVFEQGERVHLEIETYSGNTNDRFNLSCGP